MSLSSRLKKLSPEERQYITSERFIHDDLLRRCEQLVQVSHGVWRKKLDPSIVVIWPSAPVKAEDGSMIEDEILAEYQKDDMMRRLRQLVDKTKAYGMLVIELKPDALCAIFESPHGARSWRAPIERHGDRAALGKVDVKTDADHIGLLWSASQGTA